MNDGMNHGMNDELSTRLSSLHEPEAPETMKANIMARIARASDAIDSLDVPQRAPVRRESHAWSLTVLGAVLVAGVVAYGWLSAGQLPDYLSARIGSERPSLRTLPGPLTAAMVAALMAYLAGLFAPLRGHR